MTGQDNTLAARIVTGVAACMVVATAAATAVRFWLSYRGLHDFALRAGRDALHSRAQRRPLHQVEHLSDHLQRRVHSPYPRL